MCSVKACTALDPANGSADASMWFIFFGLKATFLTLAEANSASAPDPPASVSAVPYTASFFLKSETFSPTSTTIPEKSPPKVRGVVGGSPLLSPLLKYPCLIFQSLGFNPTACTSTTMCPGEIVGLGVFVLISTTSLPPYFFICAAHAREEDISWASQLFTLSDFSKKNKYPKGQRADSW